MVQHLARAKGHKVRYGKLFEIIDAVAGDVAYRHTRGIDATLVTAAVDGMTAISDITTTEDLTIQAFLTYVGSSSLEIHVNMLQVSNHLSICICKHTFDEVEVFHSAR